MLLLLDLYEKIAVSSKRRYQLAKIMGKTRTWKWFDDRTGKWCNYSTANNKTIDDAYQAGESSVKFTAGRRKYVVQFSTMVQVNEDTSNRRPIMLSLPPKEDKTKEQKDQAKPTSEGKSDQKGESKMDTEETSDNKSEVSNEKKEEAMKTESENKTEEESEEEKVISGLMPDQIQSIVRCSVYLIGLPVDPDTLHALLRLVLRLTREHQFAMTFAELGGTRLLLGLTQLSAFQGFTSLATLILRHILEEPNTMKLTLQKVSKAEAHVLLLR